MKILVINGSPRGKRSTTYLMVEEFLKGTREFGWSDQHVVLANMNIHHCLGCLHCLKHHGQGIFDDDMKKILPLLSECDVLMLATPLYFDNVTGLMKNYLDRSCASANSAWECDMNHETIHKLDRPGPKLIVLSNCGYPEQTHFEVLRVLFRRMARNMGSELIGEIYRGEGGLLQAENPEWQVIVNDYKALLRTAGREIAHNLAFSDVTKRKLEEPLIPYAEAVRAYNDYVQAFNSSQIKGAVHDRH